MKWVYMIFGIFFLGIYDIYMFSWVYMIFCIFIGGYMKLTLFFLRKKNQLLYIVHGPVLITFCTNREINHFYYQKLKYKLLIYKISPK